MFTEGLTGSCHNSNWIMQLELCKVVSYFFPLARVLIRNQIQVSQKLGQSKSHSIPVYWIAQPVLQRALQIICVPQEMFSAGKYFNYSQQSEFFHKRFRLYHVCQMLTAHSLSSCSVMLTFPWVLVVVNLVWHKVFGRKRTFDEKLNCGIVQTTPGLQRCQLQDLWNCTASGLVCSDVPNSNKGNYTEL